MRVHLTEGSVMFYNELKKTDLYKSRKESTDLNSRYGKILTDFSR